MHLLSPYVLYHLPRLSRLAEIFPSFELHTTHLSYVPFFVFISDVFLGLSRKAFLLPVGCVALKCAVLVC